MFRAITGCRSPAQRHLEIAFRSRLCYEPACPSTYFYSKLHLNLSRPDLLNPFQHGLRGLNRRAYRIPHAPHDLTGTRRTKTWKGSISKLATVDSFTL